MLVFFQCITDMIQYLVGCIYLKNVYFNSDRVYGFLKFEFVMEYKESVSGNLFD